MKLRKSKVGWNVYDGDELVGVVSIETLETDFEYWTKRAEQLGYDFAMLHEEMREDVSDE